MKECKKHSSPQGTKSGWNVICDFDGTIACFDVTDAVFERFADPAWEEVEKAWRKGAITARECMEKQVRMIHAPLARLDAFFHTVPIMDGFIEFRRFCAARDIGLLVVSDGMDYAINRILTGHGLADLPVIANRLRFQKGFGYSLDFPHAAEGCGSGVCKCAAADSWLQQKQEQGKLLLIGDGRSDTCLAGLASFVLTRRGYPLQAYCEEKAIPHADYDDFFDILRFFAGPHPAEGLPFFPLYGSAQRKTAHLAKGERTRAYRKEM